MCERELCVFAFQTLGVMNEAADEIATGAQVLHPSFSQTFLSQVPKYNLIESVGPDPSTRQDHHSQFSECSVNCHV